MREVTGNLWTYPALYRIITTNGAVRKDGACVMGRGCAREAAERFPRLPYQLGQHIKQHGNKVCIFLSYHLISFPVKHHWREKADLHLIQESVGTLGEFLDAILDPKDVVVMPRPGCGNGGLDWNNVRPLLVGLPDNVHVITWV